MVPERICGNCFHYRDKSDKQPDTGECHEGRPQCVAIPVAKRITNEASWQVVSIFPTVLKSWECGQFKPAMPPLPDTSKIPGARMLSDEVT